MAAGRTRGTQSIPSDRHSFGNTPARGGWAAHRVGRSSLREVGRKAPDAHEDKRCRFGASRCTRPEVRLLTDAGARRWML
jgi:hypothetical protein